MESDFDTLRVEIETHFAPRWRALPRPARGTRALESTTGISFEETPSATTFRLTGDACERAGTPALLAFLDGLPACRVRRLDIALDIFDPGAPAPKRLRDDFRNNRERFRTHLRKWKWWESEDGQTLYLGKGSLLVRIYQRTGEKNLRVELQARGKDAHEIAEGLLESHRASAPVEPLAVGYIRRAVDFLAPGDPDRNQSRAPLAPWWERATAHAVAPQPRGREPPRSPEDALDWIVRQVAGTIRGLRLLGYGPRLEAAIATAYIPLWLRQWIPAEKLK